LKATGKLSVSTIAQGIEAYTTEVVSQNDKGGSITSGGGFSTYYPQPPWQNAATAGYFSQVSGTVKAPFAGYSSGRGYPDITCAGSSYLTISGGYLLGVGGTSVSTPVVAGMFSLVNAARLRGGGKPIGWINPTLWGYSKSFINDVTIGKNNCTASTTCCKQGFSAAVGWDPASGLGSLDYRKFRNFMLTIANITVPSDPPTANPSQKPTRRPTRTPVRPPTQKPTVTPSEYAQNFAVSAVPLSLRNPSLAPSIVPSKVPSTTPSTNKPTQLTIKPSASPSQK
jgi:subtilase family serine protease